MAVSLAEKSGAPSQKQSAAPKPLLPLQPASMRGRIGLGLF